MRTRWWSTTAYDTPSGVSLRIEPGSGWFYAATFALAAIWTVGALVSGPIHLGRIADWRDGDRLVRPVLAPVLLGLGLSGLFVAVALTYENGVLVKGATRGDGVEPRQDDKVLTGQAVPSWGPQVAGRHLRKLDCFCFTQQTLQPG